MVMVNSRVNSQSSMEKINFEGIYPSRKLYYGTLNKDVPFNKYFNREFP